jgi:hypothetical protein
MWSQESPDTMVMDRFAGLVKQKVETMPIGRPGPQTRQRQNVGADMSLGPAWRSLAHTERHAVEPVGYSGTSDCAEV